MTLSLVSFAVFAVGALLALALTARPRLATACGAGSAVAASVLGLVPAVQALLGDAMAPLRLTWGAFGFVSMALDPLSGLFLLPIYGLTIAAAIYGAEYLQAWAGKKPLGPPWFFFNLLAASMAAVVLAQNAIFFLVAWEVMALVSFFLVTFENEKASVREAGWIYLVATHLGTAFLFPLFLLLGKSAGTYELDAFPAAAATLPAGTGVCFVLALVGFGTKAGFMPLHVWLPEAHPAAPSHVSALMSGVMIKTGIYGLVRTLTFLGPPAEWWAWTLIAIGASSGILGVLFALAQHDLKRLLAYHSVENIGIIALGLGLGLLGVCVHAPTLAVLGFAGGLLHVVNHALFKGLLFLGAGSVLHATGTREIDRLGGLLKRMRVTGACFLVGAIAICGLPPLNGFVSELLVYAGAFGASQAHTPAIALPAVAAIVALALIGGLALACFTKAFGIVFLGEPRSDAAGHAHEAGWLMRISMALLASLCFAIGLLAPAVVGALTPALGVVTGLDLGTTVASLSDARGFLTAVVLAAAALLTLVALFVTLRRLLLARRKVGESGTWDCGYAAPTARMQYTSSSFAEPTTSLFHPFLWTHHRSVAPEGYFPRSASLATHTPDLARERLFAPAFAVVSRVLTRLHWLQHGGVHLYVLYLAVTLVVLLVWKL